MKIDIDEQTKRAIPVPTKWNDRDYKALLDWQKMIGEAKISTAIKKGVLTAKVILAPLSEEFDITLSPKKRGFTRQKQEEEEGFEG